MSERSTITPDWANCQRLLRTISDLMHSLGVSSCFGHLSADVQDDEYYPATLAGVVSAQAGLSRVYERYVDSHFHLPATLLPRNAVGGYMVLDASGRSVGGPYRTYRGARWSGTHRGPGHTVTRRMESREAWLDRCVAVVDGQLDIESAWRDAQDALDVYAGVPDRYSLRGRRWFDAACQAERRAAAVAAILRKMRKDVEAEERNVS